MARRVDACRVFFFQKDCMTRSERAKIFNESSIYPVVSSEFCCGRNVADVVLALATGGARIVQFREKNISDREKWNLACMCQKIAADFGMLFMVDDDVALALACGADGVHLGQSDLPVSAARKIAPELLIGISTHNPEEIRAANLEDVDYMNIGPLFITQTKNVVYPVVGIENLIAWKDLSRKPFSVMGGIKAEHIPVLKKIGCRHIAMVTALSQAENIAEEMRKMIGLAER